MTIKLPRETLAEIMDDGPIEDRITGTGRWTTHHRMIFAHAGHFYSATYSVGSTEMQDEGPWEYEKEVECTEVHQVEKTIKVWEPVP